MRTSVDIAAAELRRALKKWLPEERMPLLKGTTHESATAKFVFGIDTKTLEARKKRIGDRLLLPVVVKDDPNYQWADSPFIAIGVPRLPSPFGSERWDITIENVDFQNELEEGERLQFRLFLAPAGASTTNAKTIMDLFEEGCVFVDGAAQAARGRGQRNPSL
jgi:hypothetical protein